MIKTSVRLLVYVRTALYTNTTIVCEHWCYLENDPPGESGLISQFYLKLQTKPNFVYGENVREVASWTWSDILRF